MGFSIDSTESEIAALPAESSSSDRVLNAIVSAGDIGEYTIVSAEAVSVQPLATDDDPCATGDQSCTIVGQPAVVVLVIGVIGLGATAVLLVILRKLCCKKKANGYQEWN